MIAVLSQLSGKSRSGCGFVLHVLTEKGTSNCYLNLCVFLILNDSCVDQRRNDHH